MAIAVCDHKLIAGLNFRLSSQRTLWTIQPMKRPTLLLRDDKVVNVFYPGVPTGYECRWDGGMV